MEPKRCSKTGGTRLVSLTKKNLHGRARLPKELNVAATRNRVSSLYATKHLKVADVSDVALFEHQPVKVPKLAKSEPRAVQTTARQLSGDARNRPTNRHFALRPFFGLSGASPYHPALNSSNYSIN
jgi:hypothetical protein